MRRLHTTIRNKSNHCKHCSSIATVNNTMNSKVIFLKTFKKQDVDYNNNNNEADTFNDAGKGNNSGATSALYSSSLKGFKIPKLPKIVNEEIELDKNDYSSSVYDHYEQDDDDPDYVLPYELSHLSSQVDACADFEFDRTRSPLATMCGDMTQQDKHNQARVESVVSCYPRKANFSSVKLTETLRGCLVATSNARTRLISMPNKHKELLLKRGRYSHRSEESTSPVQRKTILLSKPHVPSTPHELKKRSKLVQDTPKTPKEGKKVRVTNGPPTRTACSSCFSSVDHPQSYLKIDNLLRGSGNGQPSKSTS